MSHHWCDAARVEQLAHVRIEGELPSVLVQVGALAQELEQTLGRSDLLVRMRIVWLSGNHIVELPDVLGARNRTLEMQGAQHLETVPSTTDL